MSDNNTQSQLKTLAPNIYAIVIVAQETTALTPNVRYLEVLKDYSLEAAYAQAQKNLLARTPNLRSITMEMFVYRAINEFIPETPAPATLPTDERINDLIKQIIKKKDKKMLKQYQGILTIAEIALITDNFN